MSNILIIKHGSLGDIAQISGIIRDIRETYNSEKIFILTTFPYVELLSRCPYIDGVLIDRRLPRWNILYLLKLKKMIQKYNFSYVYDLQNSSRTSFYRRYLFNISNWSSTKTTLKKGTKKSDFDQEPVLERFKFQLDNSNIKTNYTLKPDFSWACINVDQIVNKFFGNKFILIFPFSSPQLSHKQWPYFNELIDKIIKRVLGYKTFTYIQEAILDRLDLKNTYGSIDDVDLDDVMSGYYVGYEGDLKTDNIGVMLATAEDLGKFIRALNDGSVFKDQKEQDIYSSIYRYDHTGLIPGYQTIAKYHKDIDTVVIQFTNTVDFEGYNWSLHEIIYNRIIKILRKRMDS